jgi:hypothetical protein
VARALVARHLGAPDRQHARHRGDHVLPPAPFHRQLHPRLQGGQMGRRNRVGLAVALPGALQVARHLRGPGRPLPKLRRFLDRLVRRARHALEQGHGDRPILALPGRVRQGRRRLRVVRRQRQHAHVLNHRALEIVQLVAVDLRRVEGEVDTVERIDGVARGAGQVRGRARPVTALAVQQDQRTQGRDVGRIGGHRGLEAALGLGLVGQIALVPQSHGHEQLGALFLRARRGRQILAVGQELVPPVVHGGQAGQLGRDHVVVGILVQRRQ